MVDATGKEIPWVDRDGRVLKTVSERYRPAPGQRFFISGGGEGPDYRWQGPRMVPIKGQESFGPPPQGVAPINAEQPLYADLPAMPDQERRVIFGLMIGQEGKTQIPIYRVYTQAGFDPDKDLLQGYSMGGFPKWRQMGGGGVISGGGPVTDWDLMTSLDGLFAAGGQVFFNGDHAYAAATGRYSGRRAADYAKGASEPVVDRAQVDAEKARVYAPVRRTSGLDWKELNAGACKVMQDYCAAVKSETLLKLGLKWFDETWRGEAANTYARNPHELVRVLEVFNIITNGEMIMEGCRARRAGTAALGFTRSDYPEMDPPDWRKWVTVRLDGSSVKTGSLALDYHGDYEKNYAEHSGL
jgi:hypothetical protein